MKKNLFIAYGCPKIVSHCCAIVFEFRSSSVSGASEALQSLPNDISLPYLGSGENLND